MHKNVHFYKTNILLPARAIIWLITLNPVESYFQPNNDLLVEL